MKYIGVGKWEVAGAKLKAGYIIHKETNSNAVSSVAGADPGFLKGGSQGNGYVYKLYM